MNKFEQLARKATMKYILAIAAPALLLLAACDGDLTQNSQATTEHSVTSTTRQSMTEDERIDMILQSVAADKGIHIPEGMAVEYADIVCTGFDDGLPFPLMVTIAADELDRWTLEQHAFLIGASVGAKCPEYSGMFGRGGSFA